MKSIVPDYDVIEYVSPEKVNRLKKEGYRLVATLKQSDFEREHTMPAFMKEKPEGMIVALWKHETSIVPPSFEGILDLPRPLCFFDLETTGLDIENDRIIEIALWRIEPDGVAYDSAKWLVRPPEPITEQISELTGITQAELDAAPVWGDVAPLVCAFMSGCDLGGHNVRSFDVPFLEAELRRVALPFPWPADVVIMDTLEIGKRQLRHTLSDMFNWYVGTSRDPELRTNNHFAPHRAMDDVMGSLLVFRQQLLHEYVGGDLPSLDAHFLAPYVDHARKLKYDDEGKVLVAFGNKHNGTKLFTVMAKDMDYIDWMIRELPAETSEIIRKFKEKYEAWRAQGA